MPGNLVQIKVIEFFPKRLKGISDRGVIDKPAELGINGSGDRDFDLWGTPPPDAGPDHRWRGLGLFKSGFNGREVAYAGAWEVELSRGASRLLGLGRSIRSGQRSKRNIS